MAPITRHEQLELDELLGDIYRGIETLPDNNGSGSRSASYNIIRTHTNAAPQNGAAANRAHSKHNKSSPQQQQQQQVIGRAHIRQYELPASSPLVSQHKQALASAAYNSSNSPITTQQHQQQPQRSTLKRSTASGENGGAYGATLQEQQQQAFAAESHQQQPQSLGSFLTRSAPSSTPEGKRRVRIVEHPERRAAARGFASNDGDDDGEGDYNEQDDDYDKQTATSSSYRNRQATPTASKSKRERVKYLNTNKLIYHQEREPHGAESDDSEENIVTAKEEEEDDDDDIDGVTRVEYYHTTWLDRQLGRASKRRSSKELSERQVKEKAMIEELKRSLKNGAITLRQSFRGKRNRDQKQRSESFDEQDFDLPNTTTLSGGHNQLDTHKRDYQLRESIANSGRNSNSTNNENSVFNSGLATVPRNYHLSPIPLKKGGDQQRHKATDFWSPSSSTGASKKRPKSPQIDKLTTSGSYIRGREPAATVQNSYSNTLATPKQTQPYLSHTLNSPLYNNNSSPQYLQNQPQQQQQQQQQPRPMQTRNQQEVSYSSRTLPSNKSQHQLLQSHYRGQQHQQAQPSTHQQQVHSGGPDKMRNPAYCAPAQHYATTGRSPSREQQQQQHQQRPISPGNTISSMPSATEVVRSALSRSNSQVSLNQLNKTINLLPNSPPPYAASPAATPTQQLRPASPSLSPSPARSPQQQHQYLPGQVVVHGTRTIGRPPQVSAHACSPSQPQHKQSQPQQQQQQQPVYANPHAALMQHRIDQQMRQSAGGVGGARSNVSSIREFNELDSLLRSLSPAGSVTTHITPGFSSRPSPATYGGYMSQKQPKAAAAAAATHAPRAQPQSQPTNQQADLYARVQKSDYQQPRPHQQQQQQQQQQVANVVVAPNQTHQPFTVDVTDKRDDENCLARQDLSEFEPPIELLPSMEDYQNITKLNPVRNHYWYKPNMSRERAINLLKDKPQGTFIVRDSNSFRGAFGLAVKVAKLPKSVLNNANLMRNSSNGGDISAEYIRHFLIEPTGSGGVVLKGYANEPVFDSLPDLIYQHSLTELALPCKLVIPRADIEDAKFNLKQKQFYDEFIASKEQAKHAPYERTSPDGGYRKYPGDVYVHNEHRIIFE